MSIDRSTSRESIRSMRDELRGSHGGRSFLGATPTDPHKAAIRDNPSLNNGRTELLEQLLQNISTGLKDVQGQQFQSRDPQQILQQLDGNQRDAPNATAFQWLASNDPELARSYGQRLIAALTSHHATLPGADSFTSGDQAAKAKKMAGGQNPQEAANKSKAPESKDASKHESVASLFAKNIAERHKAKEGSSKDAASTQPDYKEFMNAFKDTPATTAAAKHPEEKQNTAFPFPVREDPSQREKGQKHQDKDDNQDEEEETPEKAASVSAINTEPKTIGEITRQNGIPEFSV